MIVSVDCGVAYTSGNEVVHSVRYACKQKLDEIQAVNADKASDGVINGVEKKEKVQGELPVMNSVDIEKHMYMAVALAPGLDILMQSCGETCIACCILQLQCGQKSDCGTLYRQS
ncbi:hypothetical protein Ddye_019176 [Dipteronia dyeriana]|uniref:Uncharacterized protein n=1 Tax=Dipteronia dyeriana TaxID=168575 RepID=A0AAD9WUT7_9ROSI|nr:hypothetical protein Ddye_019176 [Dipteronia dyeriana]